MWIYRGGNGLAPNCPRLISPSKDYLVCSIGLPKPCLPISSWRCNNKNEDFVLRFSGNVSLQVDFFLKGGWCVQGVSNSDAALKNNNNQPCIRV